MSLLHFPFMLKLCDVCECSWFDLDQHEVLDFKGRLLEAAGAGKRLMVTLCFEVNISVSKQGHILANIVAANLASLTLFTPFSALCSWSDLD